LASLAPLQGYSSRWKDLLEEIAPDFSDAELVRIMTTEKEGKTLLDWEKGEAAARPFLMKMNLMKLEPSLYLQAFSRAPLNLFVQLLGDSRYKDLSKEERVQILTAQAASGYNDSWKEAFAAAGVEQWPPEQFMQVLSAKTPNEGAFAATAHGVKASMPYVKRMPAEFREKVMALENSDGLTVEDIDKFKISNTWIDAPKMSGSLVQTIPDEEYKKRRLPALQKKVNSLWHDLKFGSNEGELNPNLLEVYGKKYPPEVIRNILNEMLDLMEKKTPWLGTPPASDTAGLDRFYCIMLVNFEHLVEELENKNVPAETAGYLTSIAAVRLEGRCATAYQAEIQQKRDDLSENLDLDGFVKKAASNALDTAIEKIIRKQYHSDVHYLNQFRHACGLLPSPDHLAGVRPEKARETLGENWSFEQCYRDFKEGVSSEHAIEWLKSKTPDEYGPEYKELENQCKVEEERILQASVAKLKEFFPEDERKKLSNLLNTPPGPALSLDRLKNADKGLVLLETLQQALDKINGLKVNFVQSVEGLQYQILKAKNEQERQQKLQELIQKAKSSLDKTHMPTYMKNLQVLSSLSGSLPVNVERAIAFDRHMKDAKIAPAQRLEFLKVKQEYDREIAQSAEEKLDALSIDYVPSTHRLPSLACDYARRLKYNEKLLGSHKQMLIHILKEIGVVESKT
jgi:hypothetical protein